jgi:hypothetical protein
MSLSAFRDAKTSFLKQGLLSYTLLKGFLWKPLHLSKAEFDSLLQIVEQFEIIIRLQNEEQVYSLGQLPFHIGCFIGTV